MRLSEFTICVMPGAESVSICTPYKYEIPTFVGMMFKRPGNSKTIIIRGTQIVTVRDQRSHSH